MTAHCSLWKIAPIGLIVMLTSIGLRRLSSSTTCVAGTRMQDLWCFGSSFGDVATADLSLGCIGF